MAENYSFHVRNAQPGDMLATLTVLHSHPDLDSIPEIVELAERSGFSIRDRLRLEALATARDLGLVDQNSNQLTDVGEALLEIESYKPDLFPDITHGLQYMLWQSSDKWSHCFSWAYRATCQALWHQGRTRLDRRGLASEVEGRARTNFDRNDIALSPKSIGGVLMWLRELKPSVLEADNEFTVRSFCPPELFLLAIDHMYQIENLDYGANLLLNEPRQEAVCQMCLLDNSSFDRVLQYALAQFSVLDRGIGGGWGYFLRLDRKVKLGDFL